MIPLRQPTPTTPHQLLRIEVAGTILQEVAGTAHHPQEEEGAAHLIKEAVEEALAEEVMEEVIPPLGHRNSIAAPMGEVEEVAVVIQEAVADQLLKATSLDLQHPMATYPLQLRQN